MEEQKAKITDEQLKKVKDHQTKLNQMLNQIGFFDVQASAVKREFEKVNAESEKLKKELEGEYGPINIDLQTGEYTIIEEKEEEKK
jgi:peptidoglycan hydrolase CwlO-like protein